MQKIVHEITFRLCGEDVYEILTTSVFRMHLILKVPLYSYTDIPKSEKIPEIENKVYSKHFR